MSDQNTPNENNLNPFFFINLDMDTNTKINEDRYEVYVNGHYVGKKALKNQGEQLSDIDDFLKVQGHQGFTSTLEGDHYMIQTNEKEEDIASALSVYFKNR